MKHTIGVLALQGGFASHIAVLESLGANAKEVREEKDLALCDGLVIPGGESTALTKHLMLPGGGPETGKPWEPSQFYTALREFALTHPVMGTCAGLIMLARPCGDERVVPLDVLPVSVSRNAYGRQTESFIGNVELNLPGLPDGDKPYAAMFIRAPRIVDLDPEVCVLARRGKEPVMVQWRKILALAFHPELTPSDTRIHEYFLTLFQTRP